MCLCTAVAAALLLALSLASAGARAADGLERRLHAARELAGVDPERTRAVLAVLRGEAQRQGRLDVRLGADEIDCRVLTDSDGAEAARVAVAGLASTGPLPEGPHRLPWLRLRACLATALIDGGDAPAGSRVIDEVLAAATADALQPARALATLQRGVYRSRTGELLLGQQDLLAACEMLKAPGLERDLDLCLGHLANHYKRMGDLDEAQRLLAGLREAARARGALYDEGIYTLGLAQVHHGRKDWAQALLEFGEARRMAELNRDPSGVIYAEYGLAGTLLRVDRAAEALVHVEHALRLLKETPDPVQALRATVLQARLLTQTGRAAESAARLREIEPRVRARQDDVLLAAWLEAQADAQGQMGRWREAYLAQEDWKRIDRRIQEQRISEQAARLRMQYNRQRDAEDLLALRRLNEQGHRLAQTQAVAIGLFMALLLISLGYALRKFGQARRLQLLASTDELTGLPNRRALMAYAEERVRRARRRHGTLSVLMIDVDRFKSINDTHGHAVGDEVLRHIAHVLPTGLRGRDRLGRLGGEEFLVVLPGAAMDQAAQVADRMRAAIAATPLIGAAGKLHFTVSIGVAELGPPSEPIVALLARADAALYQAKGNGRNAVVRADAPPRAATGGAAAS
ncbi:MAG TPA: diguanylate cyclase [Burkholderiaceae bacterium]|nr:diguanylate cyclase [Burkholderiaceae bacterium]